MLTLKRKSSPPDRGTTASMDHDDHMGNGGTRGYVGLALARTTNTRLSNNFYYKPPQKVIQPLGKRRTYRDEKDPSRLFDTAILLHVKHPVSWGILYPSVNRNRKQAGSLLGRWLESVIMINVIYLHIGTIVLPRSGRATEPRRRGERHAWRKSRRAEPGRCAWHATWREWHRGSRKGRGTSCQKM